MLPLPIDPALPDIIDAVLRTRRCVVSSAPGSGKTTRVPPALANAIPDGRILLLQPRRVAARAAATRIAEEQGWTVGNEVGYHIRHERRTSRKTRIEIITEGILTRRLQADPFFRGSFSGHPRRIPRTQRSSRLGYCSP